MYTNLDKMKITIITVILGFYYCGCYAYPNRCVCVQNPEVSSPILTGLLPYDHEQVQGPFEDPELLVPEKKQASPSQLTTGGLSNLGPRLRKNHINFLELFELPKRGTSENSTLILLPGQLAPNVPGRPFRKREMFRIGAMEENGGTIEEKPKWEVGFASKTNPPLVRYRRRFMTPDIRLSQEYIREPKLSVDARDGNYEYEL